MGHPNSRGCRSALLAAFELVQLAGRGRIALADLGLPIGFPLRCLVDEVLVLRAAAQQILVEVDPG
jgi:hypothetical protein